VRSEGGRVRVIVAHRRPLQRSLIRFFLDPERFAVVGEAATAAEVLRLAGRYEPDAVVLEDRLATSRGSRVAREIKSRAPGAKVVLLGAEPGEATADELGADVFLEESAGLQALEFVLQTLCGAPSGEPAAAVPAGGAGPEAVPAGGSSVRVAAGAEGASNDRLARAVLLSTSERRPAETWYARLQGAAAASVVLLAVLVARAVLVPPAPPAGTGYLQAAVHSLERLVQAIQEGAPPDEIVELLGALAVQREVAQAAGADVSVLDAMIQRELAPLLPRIPREILPVVETLLGEVVGDLVPSPSPEPSPPPQLSPPPEPNPEPSPPPQLSPPPEPNPEPSPEPSAEPSPSPSPEPSPSPSPEPSPSPSPEPSPSPSPEPSPSPSPEPSPSPSPEPSPSPSPGPDEDVPAGRAEAGLSGLPLLAFAVRRRATEPIDLER
jgi:ActR/RegA family two-component response regulator